MKIVFFGTSEFAIPALRALIDSRHEVLAVVTQPDRKRGRRLVLSPPQTKVLAETKGIPVYQPVDASSAESVKYLAKLNADLFVVVSFGQILKKELLIIPKLYAINLHGSLLPRYRGAAPTNWAIINGDSESGVTIMRMNERLDEGDIILKHAVRIDENDTNMTLSEKLSEMGAKSLLEAIDLIEKGKVAFEKQDDSLATYAPKLKKEDGLIDWKEPAARIHNKVRGFLPWPSAYIHYGKKILKVLKTHLIEAPDQLPGKPGEVIAINEDGIRVRCGSGSILIAHLQLEGKTAMSSSSFLRGHRLFIGDRF
jgi:methionyl-tRNA formyltransferase